MSAGINELAQLMLESEDMVDGQEMPAAQPAGAQERNVGAGPAGAQEGDVGQEGHVDGSEEDSSDSMLVNDPIEMSYALLSMRGVRFGQTLSSTMKKIRPMKSHWSNFCAASAIQNEAAHLHFLTAEGEHDFIKMRAFINYLDGRPEVTPNLIEVGLQFMQYYLNLDCDAHMKPRVKGAIKADLVIKSVRDRHQTYRAQRDLDEGLDLQAELDLRISPKDMIGLIHLVFKPTPGSKVAKLEELSRLQTGSQIRQSMATMQRGDDIRGLMVCMNFVRTMYTVGPGGGSECDYTITKKGKTNVVGKKEYTAMAAHVNPLLDPAGFQGLCFLYRHSFMNEPFPNHLDWRDFARRPLYRQARCYQKPMDGHTMYTLWKTFYNQQGILSDKVTHQGRRQGQQEMDDHGVSNDKITRMCGYSGADGSINKKQKRSYLTNPPAEGVVERAAGDPKNTQMHCPAWSTVKSPALMQCLHQAAPYVEVERTKIEAAVAQCSSFMEKKDKRLYMAEGTIGQYENKIKRALLLLASRPYDELNLKLEEESEIIIEKFKDSFSMFSHLPVFQSVEFKNLVEDVHVAQDEEANRVVPLSITARNELERIVVTMVTPELRRQQMELRQVHGEIRQVKTLVEGIAFGGTALASTPNGLGGTASATLQQTDDEFLSDYTNGLTVSGQPRKRKHAVSRAQSLQEGMVLMSTDNFTLTDFWTEFNAGRNGIPALRTLEEKGKDWRLDPKLSNQTHKRGSKFKTFWAYRSPLYNLITYYMEVQNLDEKAALEKSNEIFLSVPVSKGTGKPNLKLIGPLFTNELKRLGGYPSRRWK